MAINEAVRLVEQEKVDMLLGFYSSAHCVPVAARVEQLKKFMWITTCISSAVLENRNLKYVFRPQPHGTQFGQTSTDFIAENAKAKLARRPKDLRVAIIYEDGAYGIDVPRATRRRKKPGINIVLKEGYAATAPDLSRARDQAQARTAGRASSHRLQPGHHAVPAPGARTGPEVQRAHRARRGLRVYGKLKEAFGKDVNYVYNVDPIAIRLLNEKSLKPGLGDSSRWSGRVLQGAEARPTFRRPHVGMALQHYVFFTDVLPRAIKKHGGIDAEALRKAALETDIPDGGTILGFGVKFFRRGPPWPARTSALPGGHAVRRRQDLHRLAEGAADRIQFCRSPKDIPTGTKCRRGQRPARRRSVMRFGGFAAVSNVSFNLAEGEILGLIGPNGSGKSTMFNVCRRPLRAERRLGALEGEEIAGLPPAAICHRGIARTFQIPRPFRRLSLVENVALAAFYGSGEHPSREEAWQRPGKRSISSSCRRARRRASTAWARRG